MTDLWHDIIKQQQALPASDDLVSPSFMPLMQLGILQVSGEDSQSFLQNLFTNDVSALNIDQSQLSGFCNAKGRLFSTFQLVRRETCYQLVLPKTMCALLKQRLSMYVLRSKVSITDETNNVHCIGLVTQDNDLFTKLNLSSPIVCHYGRDNNTNRHLCLLPEDQANDLVHTLQEQHWQLTSSTVWDLLDIKAGIPAVYPETKEKFTPQQLNLDLVNGVSFSKGCYPGQEVVARLHYLGKPSRRMFYAKVNTDAGFAVGSEIMTKNGDIAGHIVRTQIDSETTAQLLLSLKLSEHENTLFIDNVIEVQLMAQ